MCQPNNQHLYSAREFPLIIPADTAFPVGCHARYFLQQYLLKQDTILGNDVAVFSDFHTNPIQLDRHTNVMQPSTLEDYHRLFRDFLGFSHVYKGVPLHELSLCLMGDGAALSEYVVFKNNRSVAASTRSKLYGQVSRVVLYMAKQWSGRFKSHDDRPVGALLTEVAERVKLLSKQTLVRY